MDQDIMQSATTYILDLNNDIRQYNITTGNYINAYITLCFLKKLDNKDEEAIKKMLQNQKMDMAELAPIPELIQQARYFATQTYMKITALKETIKQFETDYAELEKKYNLLLEKPFPTYAQIQSYALTLNKIFATVAAQELLTKSVGYYEEISSANANG